MFKHQAGSSQVVWFLVLTVTLIVDVPAQQALSPREQLIQYVADLQKNPEDQALREKIIKLALTLNPKPIVADDAIEHEGAAESAFNAAKTDSDFGKSAAEYEKALLIAPWVAADYYNLGVAWEKAGYGQKAIPAFQLYHRRPKLAMAAVGGYTCPDTMSSIL